MQLSGVHTLCREIRKEAGILNSSELLGAIMIKEKKKNNKKTNPDSHISVTEALWAVPDKLPICNASENTQCCFLYTLFVKLCLLTCHYLANY